MKLFDWIALPKEHPFDTVISIPSLPAIPKTVTEDSASGLRQTFSEVDAKAASVLTHISVMMAGLFFLFGFGAPTKIEVAFLGFELVGYLVAALFLIRSLLHFEFYKSSDHSPMDEERNKWMLEAKREAARRMTYLNWAISIAFALTALLICAVAIEVALNLVEQNGN